MYIYIYICIYHYYISLFYSWAIVVRNRNRCERDAKELRSPASGGLVAVARATGSAPPLLRDSFASPPYHHLFRNYIYIYIYIYIEQPPASPLRIGNRQADKLNHRKFEKQKLGNSGLGHPTFESWEFEIH